MAGRGSGRGRFHGASGFGSVATRAARQVCARLRDGFAARVVRLVGVLFAMGVADPRPAGLALLALDTLARVTSCVLLGRSPLLEESPPVPKAARTAANASPSESWRVSTVTFMVAPWSGSAVTIARFDPR